MHNNKLLEQNYLQQVITLDAKRTEGSLKLIPLTGIQPGAKYVEAS